jgi:DNA-binding MarR family transcriptional regulator
MSRSDVERMAEGIVRLRAEIIRRRGSEGETIGAELTTPQALALRTIVLDGPLRMGALADALGVSVATASRTVDALAARGLVQRESDPGDARAVRVAPTGRGQREHAARRGRFVDALERLMDELSEHERRQLAESLETLNRLFGLRESKISAGGGTRARALRR